VYVEGTDIVTMKRLEWKLSIEKFLDDIEQELPPKTPLKARIALSMLRRSVNQRRFIRKRKQYEQEMEAFLRSDPFLRAAADRYIRKKARVALVAVRATMSQLEILLARLKENIRH
jgi:hypothetical protein